VSSADSDAKAYALDIHASTRRRAIDPNESADRITWRSIIRGKYFCSSPLPGKGWSVACIRRSTTPCTIKLPRKPRDEKHNHAMMNFLFMVSPFGSRTRRKGRTRQLDESHTLVSQSSDRVAVTICTLIHPGAIVDDDAFGAADPRRRR